MEAKRALKIWGKLSAAMVLLLAACGAKPQVTTSIESCGGVAEVDVVLGVLEKITVPGLDLEYIVNDDGSFTYFSKPKFTDNYPSTRQIGDLNGKHLEVELQGDTDGDGRQNVVFKSVCPDPLPKPSETPIGLLRGNIRSIVQAGQGLRPGKASSKPVRNFSVFRQG